jgi:nucleoside-diphosphate-sugar epimerase
VAAVTGAGGYVGRVIREALREQGWRVLGLVRRTTDGDDVPYDLVGGLDPAILRGVDLLVHCAWDFRTARRAESWRINVGGSRRLLDAASEAGVGRVIVVSSIAAFAGTQQRYGRAKLAIEASARARDAVVIRPGLVFGDVPGGMLGALERLVGLPLVPVPAASSHQYLLHERDLGAAVVRLANIGRLPQRPLVLAHPAPVGMEALVRELARRRGLQPTVVRVPWRPAYALMRACEATGLRLPMRADSLWGLTHPPPPPPADLDELGIRPQGFLGTARPARRLR